jgi:AmiR/NasT family two-component response regulator
MNKETILVVEDETIVGFELKEDLERLGYFVPEVLETGEAVVQAVARFRPDLMLVDIRLRGSLDGIEAVYQAKAEFDLPVIYLTAYSDPDTLRRAALTGPDAFLLKPFDERELAANVELALSRAKSVEPLRRELRGAISLVDALEEPALIAGLDGRIVHANKAAIALLRVPDPSLVARVELSRILEPGWKESGRKPIKVRDEGVAQAGKFATVERLISSGGREQGSLILFGDTQGRDSLLLEASAAEANAALLRLLPRPTAAGPGYEVGGFLEPCLSGSGDVFDVFAPREDEIAFYGLDVAGHGILASLMAISLRDLIPLLVREKGEGTPADILRSIYQRYDREGESAMKSTLFASLFAIAYGTVDASTGDYRVARSGYPPALHLGTGGRMRASDPSRAKGADSGETTGTLYPGDRLILASGGLLAAFGADPTESPIGNSIESLVAFARGIQGAALVDFVGEFRRRYREARRGGLKEDDASLLVIERSQWGGSAGREGPQALPRLHVRG